MTKPEADILYRKPTKNDAAAMWQLVKDTSLDVNSSYTYLMMAKFFSDRCIVAHDITNKPDPKLVGMVTGFVFAESSDTYFVWQVAVNPDYRGLGVARNMIERMCAETQAKHIMATVTEDNEASMELFKTIAHGYNTWFSTMEGFDGEDFPDTHETEMLVRVGPIEQ